MRLPSSLAKSVLYLSLLLIFAFLTLTRPPIPFYTLPLVPIALAALIYEFSGGTLVAVAAMAGAGLLIALDSDAARRAIRLQEAWPILSMYLAVGPLVGWLATRERERERRLVSGARRLHVVQEIAQAINTSLDLDQILRTIIAETGRLIPFQRAAVMLLEGDTLLRVVAFNEGPRQSTDLEGLTFTLKGSAAGWAVTHRRIWVGEPADAHRYPDTRRLCPPDQPCLIVPLRFQQRVIGVFMLGGVGLSTLPPADLDNLTQITGQMAAAIEHARLYELERRRSKRMTAMSEACREITTSLDLERTLKLVMDKAVETLPMDAGAVFQYEPRSQAYRVAVSHNLSPDYVAKITFDFEEGVPGWVVKHGHSLIIPDAAADARVHPYVLQEGVRAVLATPLLAREAVVGVLTLYCKAEADVFDDEAVQLAEVFAAQAAVAVENARLVEELRQATIELEARVEQRTRQLRETQAQIVRTEKMAVVGRLAGSVAHEVNNPLQAITLQLQLITEEELPESICKRLVIVQQEVVRIADIVQRLLDFQRPTVGIRSPHNISALLDDVLALADKQLQQHQVTVIRQEQPDLEPVLVSGNQMKQVFLNLVLNAGEAMPEGGQLQVKTGRSNGMVAVTFTDTGLGMTPRVMEQLFEPFFSTKANGTGLGLAVSHEIVTQHEGRLEAKSRPNEGSTFTVKLPIYKKPKDINSAEKVTGTYQRK